MQAFVLEHESLHQSRMELEVVRSRTDTLALCSRLLQRLRRRARRFSHRRGAPQAQLVLHAPPRPAVLPRLQRWLRRSLAAPCSAGSPAVSIAQPGQQAGSSRC